jgi:hypothetical protein
MKWLQGLKLLWLLSISACGATPDLELRFAVTEWAGVARTNEVLSSGVPLPREAQVFSTAQLGVATEDGQRVPACFHVLARWNSGHTDTNAPLQWVLVEMPASLPARSSQHYRLIVTDSPMPPPPLPFKLTLVQTGNEIRVDTGTAQFLLGRNPDCLFDEIHLADETLAATGQPLTALAENVATRHTALRRIVVERCNDLAATVVVEGAFDLPPVGSAGLASRRRYQFFAGSSTVLIRHEVAWEGERFSMGILAQDGVPNGVRIQQVRDAITVPWTGPRQVSIWGERDAEPVAGTVAAADSAWLEQQLRARRTDSRRYQIGLGGLRQSGVAATAGVLSGSDGAKTVAIALNHLHCYEPQALRCLPDGTLAIDVASDSVWLGARQGLFASFGLCVAAGNLASAAIEAGLWAKLNHPLRAWPSPNWFALAKATEEIPVGPLAAPWESYDTLVRTVLTRTTNLVATLGLTGLQTYGLFPRYWGEPGGYNEIATDPDPTPDQPWDDTYWGATWTDYHNTSALATYWAMRSGETFWLDEVSTPAAWRMLHTQIVHGAPDDPYFYIGQAPTGYGGYRADFNSSHAYFDNLILHYWLTGDRTVVETLTRGAETMRQFLYPGRPGVPCDPLFPPANEWAHPVGRVASQWIQTFRFVGLAGDDASFLEDYRGNLARAVSQYYAELQQGDRRFGFWCDTPLASPGTHHTDQLWMLTLYDMNNLNRWRVDSRDTPLGNPALRPSAILTAWARTLSSLAPFANPGGDGTVAGRWPNALEFAWTGDRLGGQLLSVTNFVNPVADPVLWDTGKATLAAAVSRAADWLNDPVLRQTAADIVDLALRASWNQGQPPPLGKEQGLYLSRLTAAVARLNAAAARHCDIQWSGPRLRLSWSPSEPPGWLETATDIAGPWQPVTHLWPATSTEIDITPTDRRFYRLRIPD